MSFMDLINPIGAAVQTHNQDEALSKAYGAQTKAAREQKRLMELSLAEMRPFYDLTLPAFKSYVSGVTGGIDPNTGRTWTPTTSPAFQWEQQQANKATNRSLRALGRSNSTFGANTITESNRNLAANEYDRQLGRLGTAGNISQNAAGSLANIRNHLGTNAIQQGENTANYNLSLGALKNGIIDKQNQGVSDVISTVAKMYGGGMLNGLFKGGGDSLNGAGNSFGVMQKDQGYGGWNPNGAFGG